MSFLQNEYGGGSHKERFSLLSLSPDEIYFNDFSVLYVRSHPKTQTTEIIKGRLKICSLSVVFDTKICAVPNVKFPLDSVEEISSLKNEWTKANGYDGRTIVLRTTMTVELKENNIIAPFKFKEHPSAESHMFVLTHSYPDDCLPLVQQLHRAAMAKTHGDISDGKFMIQAITLSMSSRMSFDLTHLVDGFERPSLEMDAVRIGPLVKNPGKILLTQTRLYFQAFNNIDAGQPMVIVKLSDVKSARRRRVLMRHVGLEIAYSERQSHSPKLLFIQFHNMADRDQICTHLARIPGVVIDCSDEKNMLIKWQSGAISNYEYLEYLNRFDSLPNHIDAIRAFRRTNHGLTVEYCAGPRIDLPECLVNAGYVADRSFNDLTQYPVFPWVIADYTSSHLDLTNPETFRDLSKPIGALNPKRLNVLKERYEDMIEPKFLYGSHYSTPGDVLFYLARAAPEYTLCLHNGKFDQPDRMFRSVAETWDNLMKSTSDFKEMIPEFYQTQSTEDGKEPGFFLNNYQNIDFGRTQDGVKIGDVEYPPWAESSRDFVVKLREALESEYVSSNLHHWIDLIFGYKQRGEEAFRANNIFYHLTYEGAVDLDNLPDANERASIEAQINEFGQTPRQLFFGPHPARFANRDLDDSINDDIASKAYDILMAEKLRADVMLASDDVTGDEDDDGLCDRLCSNMKVCDTNNSAIRADGNQNQIQVGKFASGVTSARFGRRNQGATVTSSMTSPVIEERDQETASLLSSLAQLRQVAQHNLHKK